MRLMVRPHHTAGPPLLVASVGGRTMRLMVRPQSAAGMLQAPQPSWPGASQEQELLVVQAQQLRRAPKLLEQLVQRGVQL